jgi:hypothetical protein
MVRTVVEVRPPGSKQKVLLHLAAKHLEAILANPRLSFLSLTNRQRRHILIKKISLF